MIMAEHRDKAADDPPRKNKVGLIVGLLIAATTVIAGSVAGAILGPRWLGGSEAHSGSTQAGVDAPEKLVSVDVPPIIVDLRDGDGRIRHLKVGFVAELSDGVSIEDFRQMSPRGREASLSYLRSLSFEEVSDPRQFALIKGELAKRVTDAVGAHRVSRLLLTDFVLQ